MPFWLPVVTVTLRRLFRRSTSCAWTSWTKSSSPAASAAIRAAPERIGVWIDLGDLERRGGVLAPVLLVALQHGADAGLARHERVGAGAVGVARREAFGRETPILRLRRAARLGPGAVQDEHAGEGVREQRVRALGPDAERQVVDLGDAVDRGEERPQVRGRRQRPLQREHDVVGGERGAVVELHARPEPELPALRVEGERPPRRRELADELALRAARHERVVDLAVERLRAGVARRVRIERQRIAHRGPADGAGLARGGQASMSASAAATAGILFRMSLPRRPIIARPRRQAKCFESFSSWPW